MLREGLSTSRVGRCLGCVLGLLLLVEWVPWLLLRGLLEVSRVRYFIFAIKSVGRATVMAIARLRLPVVGHWVG